MAREITAERKPFGLRLKALRVLSGREVREIADELGISPQSWYAYETGASEFGYTMLPKVARALRVPQSRLTERIYSDDEYVMGESARERTGLPRFSRGVAALAAALVDSTPRRQLAPSLR